MRKLRSQRRENEQVFMVINWFLLAFDYSFTNYNRRNRILTNAEDEAKKLRLSDDCSAQKLIILATSISCESFALVNESRKSFLFLFSCVVCAAEQEKSLINKTLQKELVSLFEKQSSSDVTLMHSALCFFLFKMHCWTKIFALYFHRIAALERVDFTSFVSKGKQRRMLSRVLECIFANDFFVNFFVVVAWSVQAEVMSDFDRISITWTEIVGNLLFGVLLVDIFCLMNF